MAPTEAISQFIKSFPNKANTSVDKYKSTSKRTPIIARIRFVFFIKIPNSFCLILKYIRFPKHPEAVYRKQQMQRLSPISLSYCKQRYSASLFTLFLLYDKKGVFHDEFYRNRKNLTKHIAEYFGNDKRTTKYETDRVK